MKTIKNIKNMIVRINQLFCRKMDMEEQTYEKIISFARIFYKSVDLIDLNGTWRMVCGNVILNDSIPDGKQDVTRNNLRRQIQNIPDIKEDLEDYYRLYAAISSGIEPLPNGQPGYRIGNHKLLYTERYMLCHELARKLHTAYKEMYKEARDE
jgi:hypothetical protein